MKGIGLIVERSAPVLLGIAGAATFLLFFRDGLPKETPKELLSAGVSIGAIAVGFLANSKAILFSIDRKRIISQLKSADYYKYLVGYLMSAINWSLALAVLSGIGLLVDLKTRGGWHPWAAAVWLLCAITSIAAYYRVINIFTRILRSAE